MKTNDIFKKHNRLSDLLYQHSENNNEALVCGEQSLRYKEWHVASTKLSTWISKKTKKPIVVILIDNSIEYAIAYFGVTFCNKIIMPLSVNLSIREYNNILSNIDADLIITLSKYRDIIDQIDLKTCKIMYMDSQTCSYIDEPKEGCTSSENDMEDVALLLTTSGSTGIPKIVMLTHNNLLENAMASCKSGKICENDVTLIHLPMCYGFCNTAQLLSHVYVGGKIVIAKNPFYPTTFFDFSIRHNITNLALVPSMALSLIRMPSNKISSVLKIFIAGAPIQSSMMDDLVQLYPSFKFYVSYGLTECSTRVSLLDHEYLSSKKGSVGKPVEKVLVKISCNQKECDAYIEGEVLVKGPNVMKGYYKDPQTTKLVLDEGWFHTGDIGYLDSEGYLFLVGRYKNIIIRNGINIYPEEVEQVLMDHSKILDAYVYGKKDPIEGEVPYACVVLKEQCPIAALREYCSKNLASYKVPVNFFVVSQIKKTSTGKTDRSMIYEPGE